MNNERIIKKIKKRNFIIIYILYFIINIFIGYNLNNLTSTEKVDSNYEKWLGLKEEHLKLLERDILKVNHYIENNRHFYNINIIKKFDEDIENKDIKGLDANNFYVDVEKESDKVVFINRYKLFNDVPRLSEKGRDKVKYEISNITISSPIELKTFSVKDKDYSDYMTSNIFDEYKNEINSLTEEDFEFGINNKTDAAILYIIGATFLICFNVFTNFLVFTISDIDEDDEKSHNTLHIFIITNIAIYSSFLIVKILS